jgi:hypothetical protein
VERGKDGGQIDDQSDHAARLHRLLDGSTRPGDRGSANDLSDDKRRDREDR